MSFNDLVYEALPYRGSITYPELRKVLGNRAQSQIGTALRELEAAGKVKRERIPKPSSRKGSLIDFSRSPKVMWRRLG